MNWKRLWKKTWYFIWESDSILSWIVNIILAFVIIKFLVYPGLGFIMQTSHPVVAVVSGSMEHKTVYPCIKMDNSGCIQKNYDYYGMCGKSFEEKQDVDLNFFWETCGEWYSENTDITLNDFSDFKLKNGFNKGDIMVLRGIEPEKIQIGDTIVYTGTSSYPIIHRVVKIQEGNTFITKGDHNSGSDSPINEKQIIGKAVFRVPLLGWIKIGFVKLIYVFR